MKNYFASTTLIFLVHGNDAKSKYDVLQDKFLRHKRRKHILQKNDSYYIKFIIKVDA